MELMECLKGRRSIRKWKDEPVTEEEILEVIKAATYAPSWKNSQVSRYYVASSKEARDAIYDSLIDRNQASTQNCPVYIVTTIVKNRSGYNREGIADTHLGAGFQCYDNGLQSMNLCLRAYELGLGTLIMGLYYEEKVRAYFEVPEDQDIVAVIALGHADIDPDMPKRKELESVVTFK